MPDTDDPVHPQDYNGEHVDGIHVEAPDHVEDIEAKPRPPIDNLDPASSLQLALAYARAGRAIVPLWWVRDGRCACPKGDCGRNTGKHPIPSPAFAPNGAIDAKLNESIITGWFRRFPMMNWGYIPADGEWVLDLDNPGEFVREVWAAKLPSPGVVVESSEGKFHHLLRGVAPVTTRIDGILDIRRYGGNLYAVGPGSTHLSGQPYRLLTPVDDVASPPAAPLGLAEAIDAKAKPKAGTGSPGAGPDRCATEWCGASGPFKRDPGGHHQLLSYAGHLRARHRMSEAMVRKALMERVALFDPPYADPVAEVERVIKWDRDNPGRIPLDDDVPGAEPKSYWLEDLVVEPYREPDYGLLAAEGATILFGPGGAGKGVAVVWLVCQLVHDGKHVVIADYERHPNEWKPRIESLYRATYGSSVPTGSVRYLPVLDRKAGWKPGSLMQQAPDIRRHLDAVGTEYGPEDVLIIDSLLRACGAGNPSDPMTVNNFDLAVETVGLRPLCIGHVTKETDDARYPFGSVNWHNWARMTLGTVKVRGPQGEHGMTLKVRKNTGGPDGFRVEVEVEWGLGGGLVGVHVSTEMESLLERVIDWVRLNGPGGPVDIAKGLAPTAAPVEVRRQSIAIQKTVSRHILRGGTDVTRDPDGTVRVVRLSSRPENEDDDDDE